MPKFDIPDFVVFDRGGGLVKDRPGANVVRRHRRLNGYADAAFSQLRG